MAVSTYTQNIWLNKSCFQSFLLCKTSLLGENKKDQILPLAAIFGTNKMHIIFCNFELEDLSSGFKGQSYLVLQSQGNYDTGEEVPSFFSFKPPFCQNPGVNSSTKIASQGGPF